MTNLWQIDGNCGKNVATDGQTWQMYGKLWQIVETYVTFMANYVKLWKMLMSTLWQVVESCGQLLKNMENLLQILSNLWQIMTNLWQIMANCGNFVTISDKFRQKFFKKNRFDQFRHFLNKLITISYDFQAICHKIFHKFRSNLLIFLPFSTNSHIFPQISTFPPRGGPTLTNFAANCANSTQR